MIDSDKNIVYYLNDTLDLYFYVTDENDTLITGDDWHDAKITIKDDFNATSPITILDAHAGEFTTYEQGVTPGNVHFFLSASNLSLLTEGMWEYRVVISKDAAGEIPAERITAATERLFAT